MEYKRIIKRLEDRVNPIDITYSIKKYGFNKKRIWSLSSGDLKK